MVYTAVSRPLLLKIYVFEVFTHTCVHALTSTEVYNVSMNILQVFSIFCVPTLT